VPQIPRGSKMDVFCFPVIAWDFRFQRPQQIVTQFAGDGHRVFYLNTQLTADARVQVRPIRDHIFELTVPGSPQTVIYHDALTGPLFDRVVEGLETFIEQQQIEEA
jgi:hypothetical protein